MSREELREAFKRWLDENVTTTRIEHKEKPYGWTEYTVQPSALEAFDEFIAPLVEALDCIGGGHPCDQSHREDAFLALSEFYRKLDIKRFL